METYITKLEELEFIAGDGGISIEFQVFYDDGEPLDLQDDKVKWYLAPIGKRHNPIITKSIKAVTEKDQNNKTVCYRFIVNLTSNETKNLYGKYIHQPVITDRKGNTFRRAEGYINFRPQIGS